MENLFEYQLEYSPRMNWTDLERAEAYKSLAEKGTWNEGMWWRPGKLPRTNSSSRESAAHRVINDAGFRVVDRCIAEEPDEA